MLKAKIKKLCNFHRMMAVAALSVLAVVSVHYPVLGQAVTQGYGSDQTLQRGMLVKLKDSDSTKAEAIAQSTAESIHGVVVDANDAPVTLSTDDKKVFIATAGHYEVLVSTQNGAIKAGDYITISAIDGIGMRVDNQQPIVIGRALADFDGKTNVVSSAEVIDSAGAKQQVTIGRVKADITISRNPFLKAADDNLPEFLKKASEALAGKPVNPVRVYIALFVFLITTIVSGVLMYGAVRSAIISIGRNPLGKKSIIRGMFQVIIVGMIVFITGVFGVYLILKI